MKPRESWMMFGTHGPDSPSSAVSLLNWSRWADAVPGRPIVHAIPAASAIRAKARAGAAGLPGTHMTRGG
jgi:hypothetical protein